MPVPLAKDIYIFTDCDLDGAMCHIMMQWYTDSHIKYHVTRVDDFRATFSSWASKNLDKFKAVYILDLDVSSCIDIVDKPNITIIDHHDSHVSNKHKYKNAKVFIEKQSSCAKLLYNILSTSKIDFMTKEKKLLLGLVDDYDSYTLKTPVSRDLNTIFWSYQGDRVQKFISDWNDGFKGFTDQHNRILHFKNKALAATIKDLEVFEMKTFEYDNDIYSIYSTVATTAINEIASHLLTEYNCDISIVVNTNSKKVSFRKNKNTNVNLSLFANKICDGSGHTHAAGGPFNEKFLNFSRLFKRIK
jgi:nanoRNase/pAp phosphatase (c-di-AMP/oligoRNAs hydrolase)